jgi:sec-independent protein translocase protein TatA
VYMGLSLSHLLIILVIVLVLFGAGKLPQMMSDMGKGMKAFKDGVKDEEKGKKNSKTPVVVKPKNGAVKPKTALKTKVAVKNKPKKKEVAKPKELAKVKAKAKPTKAATKVKAVAKKIPAKVKKA